LNHLAKSCRPVIVAEFASAWYCFQEEWFNLALATQTGRIAATDRTTPLYRERPPASVGDLQSRKSHPTPAGDRFRPSAAWGEAPAKALYNQSGMD
jgi:hypothetical protein